VTLNYNSFYFISFAGSTVRLTVVVAVVVAIIVVAAIVVVIVVMRRRRRRRRLVKTERFELSS